MLCNKYIFSLLVVATLTADDFEPSFAWHEDITAFIFTQVIIWFNIAFIFLMIAACFIFIKRYLKKK